MEDSKKHNLGTGGKSAASGAGMNARGNFIRRLRR
jgi:hypothetical protein